MSSKDYLKELAGALFGALLLYLNIWLWWALLGGLSQ